MSLQTPSGAVISEQANLQNSLKVVPTQLPLYESTRAGRTYHASLVAGGAVLPIFSNTTQEAGIWNPSGSGVVAVLNSVALTYVSTTGAAGGFVLAALVNAGSTVATGAAISAWTDGTANATIWSGMVGNAISNKVRFANNAATVTAPVRYADLGINQLVLTAADATQNQWLTRVDFRGEIILPPGNALFVTGNIATLVTEVVTICWTEESES